MYVTPTASFIPPKSFSLHQPHYHDPLQPSFTSIILQHPHFFPSPSPTSRATTTTTRATSQHPSSPQPVFTQLSGRTFISCLLSSSLPLPITRLLLSSPSSLLFPPLALFFHQQSHPPHLRPISTTFSASPFPFTVSFHTYVDPFFPSLSIRQLLSHLSLLTHHLFFLLSSLLSNSHNLLQSSFCSSPLDYLPPILLSSSNTLPFSFLSRSPFRSRPYYPTSSLILAHSLPPILRLLCLSSQCRGNEYTARPIFPCLLSLPCFFGE